MATFLVGDTFLVSLFFSVHGEGFGHGFMSNIEVLFSLCNVGTEWNRATSKQIFKCDSKASRRLND